MNKWESEKENLDRLINVEKVSYEEIGRKYGCSGANIKKQAKLLGIKIPQRRKINPQETFNRIKESNKCLVCGKEIGRRSKFCSNTCSAEYKRIEYIERWKRGEETGTIGKDDIATAVRLYLREKYNNSCQRCGWNVINEYTGIVPLQIHHIDGDCTNNYEDNLQLLCPNCHALTDNFGSRNENCTRIDKRYR